VFIVSFKELIAEECIKEIRVIAPEHQLFGKTIKGAIIYFDHQHTGNSADLIAAYDPETGLDHRLLSTQVDMDYYHEQELAEQIKRLGANVGDSVMVTRTGSGYPTHGFNKSLPHVITKISYDGYVEFDDYYEMFRPDVQLIKEVDQANVSVRT
jgi:hypothetical protein